MSDHDPRRAATPADDLDDETSHELVDRAEIGERLSDIKRHYGTGPAIIAAAGLGLEQVIFGRDRADPAIHVTAPSEPLDPDVDGISLSVRADEEHAGSVEVEVEPQQRHTPILRPGERYERRDPSV